MTATAIFQELETTQARGKSEAGERWQKLILDTKRGTRRDSAESLEIMKADGKTLADLRSEVQKLQKIDSLNSELSKLRGVRAERTKLTEQRNQIDTRHAAAVAAYNETIALVDAEMRKIDARVSRIDAIGDELRKLGVQTTEAVLSERFNAIGRMTARRDKLQRELKQKKELLEFEEKDLAELKENVKGGSGLHPARLKELQADLGSLTFKVNQQREAIKRDEAEIVRATTEIETRKADLESTKLKLLEDPNAEI